MRLGSSIRRRRGSGGTTWSLKRFLSKKPQQGGKVGQGGGGGWRFFTFLRDPVTLGILAVLAVLGFSGGYFFSTRVVYPLPPPPGDLFPVPNLTGHLPGAALDTLAALDLVIGSVDSLSHPTVPEGEIVGQSPLPGQLTLAGDTVRIAMSTGPEQRAVPDVMNLMGDWARTILETSGFVVTVDSIRSEDPRGAVISMDPEPGTEATIPMGVLISVSLGPPEFEMPQLVGVSEDEARSTIESSGLILRDVQTRFRFGRDQGMVVDQEPPAGTMVREGSPVRLVVGRRGQ